MEIPFVYITASHAIGNAIHLTLYFFYYVPMVFFNIEVLKTYSHYCGIILIMCFEISIYSHTLISLNRFCAIHLPFRYQQIFTFHNTLALIILVWILSVVPIIYIYGIGGCHFQYFSDYWRFGINLNENCPVIPFPTNISSFSVLLSITIFLDFITLYRIRVFNVLVRILDMI
ncbi:hypothetical protein DICVIV_04594 [Dictyocaulus viviparus]|uniref:G-protein coupled receptors family 1 profile domain-containing protein n=1 Tax=Dictyocaulus viviparus TaxID=29172 RepID=A0A0D8XZI0_DICVI|nr:hypothetical protein DICVIV_04594 [Dictyocaulus viviparus]